MNSLNMSLCRFHGSSRAWRAKKKLVWWAVVLSDIALQFGSDSDGPYSLDALPIT